MDTSGRVTGLTVKPYCLSTRAVYFTRFYTLIIFAVLILVTNGCMPTIELGIPPQTDRLDQLTIDVSTSQDVKAILGEPQGHGAVRSPSFGVKETWVYESVKVEGSKSHLRMLMVFLDKERGVYQGHMWFTSGLLLGQTE